MMLTSSYRPGLVAECPNHCLAQGEEEEELDPELEARVKRLRVE